MEAHRAGRPGHLARHIARLFVQSPTFADRKTGSSAFVFSARRSFLGVVRSRALGIDRECASLILDVDRIVTRSNLK